MLKKTKNKLGFQTLLYPKGGIQAAITEVRAAGYDGIEMFDKDFIFEGGCVATGCVSGIRAGLEKTGLNLACLGIGFLESRDNLAPMKELCRTAAALKGANVFLLAPRTGTCDFPTYVSLAKELCGIAEDCGVYPSVHNHVGTLVQSLDDSVRMLDALSKDRLGICFDNAHYMFYERDIPKVVRTLGKRITYVHLKDIRTTTFDAPQSITMEAAGREFCDIGDGAADFKAVLRALKDVTYDGWLTVEIERDVYGTPEHLRRNYNRLHELL